MLKIKCLWNYENSFSKMERTLEEIVSEVLRSPLLRCTLENTVRDIQQNPGSSTASSNTNVSPLMRTSNPSDNIRPSSLSVPQELHRLFPSIRRPINSTQSDPKRGNKRKRNEEAHFCKDVILVGDPHEQKTLRGIDKSNAFEKGYAMSSVEFNIKWTFDEMITFIKNLFNKYLAGVDCEIMVPIGGRLVRPSLPPGKELTARSLKSIFFQKSVYIRPFVALYENGSENEVVEETATTTCNENVELVLPVPESPANSEIEPGPSFPASASAINVNITDNSDHLFESDLELAIRNSLDEINNQKQEKTLKAILQELRGKINEDSITQVNVYREDVFSCCVRAINRPSFNPFNRISVNFSDIEGISEQAVDLGGPSRELFRLVMDYLQNSNLFFGGNKKSIRLDRESLEKKHYFNAGRLISLSAIHGGPAPHFFTENLYFLLTSGIAENVPSVDDLEDDIKEKVVKMNEIEDIDVLQDYVTETEKPLFAIAGCHYIKSIEEKQKVFRDIVQFYGFHRVRPALDQFKEGLEMGNVLNLMKRYSVVFKDWMCGDKTELTADFMQNLFLVDLSPIGSSKRSIENRVISFWRDFVIDCYEGDCEINLQKILIFCTGADEVPPLGFNEVPRIMFLHDDSIYPKSNTCAVQLHLPTVHKTYDDFKKNVEFGIGNAEEFGFA